MTESLHSIPTPRVYVDRARLQSNIAAMQSRASGAGIRLRPHAKTHKSPAIARLQIDAGAVGVCCAKLGEAEVFADAGIKDIRLPYPTNPMNANRVLTLQDRVRDAILEFMPARHQSAPRGRAGRADMEVGESQTLPVQPVEIRSLQHRVAMRRNIAVSLIVR